MCRIKPLLLLALIMIFLSPAFAQRKQKEELQTELENMKKDLERVRQDLKLKSDSIAGLAAANKELKERNSDLEGPSRYQYQLPYTHVFTQKWMARNLNEDDIKKICPDIKIIDIEKPEEWNKADYPAYCYHRSDKLHQNGVLLNKQALIHLKTRLSDLRLEWRIPDEDDFKDLEKNLKEKVKSGFDLVHMLKSGSTGVGSWEKPGGDFFGMDFLPYSYRRNTPKEWYQKDVCSVYCYDEADAKLKSAIKIMEISSDPAYKNTLSVPQLDLTGEDNVFGVYVRLIGKR